MSETTTDTPENDDPVVRSDEDRRVLRWRFREIRRLGLSHIEARLLAETGADLGVLRQLVANGCPPSLALKIAL
jgi:hypothetical protein